MSAPEGAKSTPGPAARDRALAHRLLKDFRSGYGRYQSNFDQELYRRDRGGGYLDTSRPRIVTVPLAVDQITGALPRTDALLQRPPGPLTVADWKVLVEAYPVILKSWQSCAVDAYCVLDALPRKYWSHFQVRVPESPEVGFSFMPEPDFREIAVRLFEQVRLESWNPYPERLLFWRVWRRVF